MLGGVIELEYVARGGYFGFNYIIGKRNKE